MTREYHYRGFVLFAARMAEKQYCVWRANKVGIATPLITAELPVGKTKAQVQRALDKFAEKRKLN